MLRTKLNTKDKEHKEPNKDIPEYKEPNKEKSVKKAKKTYKHIMFNDNVDVIQDKSDENVESYKYNNENIKDNMEIDDIIDNNNIDKNIDINSDTDNVNQNITNNSNEFTYTFAKLSM